MNVLQRHDRVPGERAEHQHAAARREAISGVARVAPSRSPARSAARRVALQERDRRSSVARREDAEVAGVRVGVADDGERVDGGHDQHGRGEDRGRQPRRSGASAATPAAERQRDGGRERVEIADLEAAEHGEEHARGEQPGGDAERAGAGQRGRSRACTAAGRRRRRRRDARSPRPPPAALHHDRRRDRGAPKIRAGTSSLPSSAPRSPPVPTSRAGPGGPGTFSRMRVRPRRAEPREAVVAERRAQRAAVARAERVRLLAPGRRAHDREPAQPHRQRDATPPQREPRRSAAAGRRDEQDDQRRYRHQRLEELDVERRARSPRPRRPSPTPRRCAPSGQARRRRAARARSRARPSCRCAPSARRRAARPARAADASPAVRPHSIRAEHEHQRDARGARRAPRASAARCVPKPSSFVAATCGHSDGAGLSIATLPPGSSAPNRKSCHDVPMLRTAAS